MRKQFSKFIKPAQSILTREEREEWRKQFAGEVVKLAKKAPDRETFLKQLHDDVLPALGAELTKIGTGSSRSVFSLPFQLVLKVERPYQGNIRFIESSERRPDWSTNRAEIERSTLFPGFVPRVYGECYKAFESAHKTINIAIAEAVIPFHTFFEEMTEALGSTNGANLGVCPDTGRVLAMDVGSAWAEGVEVAFMKGTHPLMQKAPFLRAPRWSE